MDKKYEHPKFIIHNNDCTTVDIENESVDTIITDPPYELNFMNNKWDKTGIAFNSETWARFLQIAKPGAILLAFGGTRTFHRIACAIEDGGWIIKDCLSWNYSSGFPKSLDISKAIDKSKGAKREVIGSKVGLPGYSDTKTDSVNKVYGDLSNSEGECSITAPATDEAKLWDGWGTCLKPAWEPIIVAQKPLDGTYANNALVHGVAGLNIKDSRVPCQAEGVLGRFPANFILSHHEECEYEGLGKVKGTKPHAVHSNVDKYGGWGSITNKSGEVVNRFEDNDGYESIEKWKCHPDCAVRLLNEQSGNISFGKKSGGYTYDKQYNVDGFVKQCIPKAPSNYGDSGGASRFFYVTKANKKERNIGLPDGIINTHDTVKPVELMKYLCMLTSTPTGGVVFDPFMGSGTTGVACMKTGRKFIGCEMQQEYYTIANYRIKHAAELNKEKDLFENPE